MDALNFLLAIAAFLVPIGMAWLIINRKEWKHEFRPMYRHRLEK